MKFGVREICDVVLKAKGNQKVGNKIFYKNEPVIYFDTLKTSTLEGAATTVYAQGGKGNARLMAWEGERTLTFTMEDALISPAGFMILSGAGLTEATTDTPVYVHVTEQVKVENADGSIVLKQEPYVDKTKQDTEDYIYVMVLNDEGEVSTEPYIYTTSDNGEAEDYTIELKSKVTSRKYAADNNKPKQGDIVLVDYYTKKVSGAQQIDITPDKFGGTYYLEASTLFRNTNGVDMPAEFIIPNCKIQSNFTFSMASSGDPSAFTFTMDDFPDYTRFDPTKKVLAAIQVISTTENEVELIRENTKSTHIEIDGIIYDDNETDPTVPSVG